MDDTENMSSFHKATTSLTPKTPNLKGTIQLLELYTNSCNFVKLLTRNWKKNKCMKKGALERFVTRV